MSARRIVTLLLSHALGYLVVVLAFYAWLRQEVAAQYRVGDRISTDGDSLGVPLFGFAVALGLAWIGAVIVWASIRRVRARRAKAAV